MGHNDRMKIKFVSKALPDKTFKVITFKGTEGISKTYAYEITLASKDYEIDLKSVLQQAATLSFIPVDKEEIPIHGILSEFEQLNENNNECVYRAVLVPRLWRTRLYKENQVFLEKNIPEIIEEILKQNGFTTNDYELKPTQKYSAWEYLCQYQETDFDFISRLMEREGMYFFFEQTEFEDKVIITDTLSRHKDISGEKIISYYPLHGLSIPDNFVITSFQCKQKMMPEKIILKDYNYRKPSLDLKVEYPVDPDGFGDVYSYGEHFKTPEEGKAIAKIRAEEILCKEKVFYGESTVPTFFSGGTFEMDRHFRQGFNGPDNKYLLIELEHEGYQDYAGLSGIGEQDGTGGAKLTYKNSFVAIPAKVQFRPERKTPKPQVSGTINANVDAAGSGEFAEIDDQGRYKISLPFDLGDKAAGKASRYVRMAQPYAGSNFGMHFPLHKGTETLLTFIGGDPDRPIVNSVVPNPETPSPVSSENHTKNIIVSAGQNKIELEDKSPFHILLTNAEDKNNVLMTTDGPKIRVNSGDNLMVFDAEAPKINISTDGEMEQTASKDINISTNKSWNLEASVPDGLWAKVKGVLETVQSVLSGDIFKPKPTPPDISMVAHKKNIETTAKKGDIKVTAEKKNILLETSTKSIRLNAKQNINLMARKNISLYAKGKIASISKKDTIIKSMKNFKLEAKKKIKMASKEDTFEATSKKDFKIKSQEQKLKMGSKKGTFITSDNKIEVIGKDKINISGTKNITINSQKGITLKSGAASISIKNDGSIDIKGVKININAQAKLKSSGAMNEIKGSLVKIN